MLAGVGFGGCELTWLIVLHVSPDEAVEDHLSVDESLTGINATDLPLVAVDVDDFDVDRLLENLVTERLARFAANRLALLRRVDAGKPDLVLRLRIVEHGQRVAITDRHDLSGECVMRFPFRGD
jgi:hypothetical protein